MAGDWEVTESAGTSGTEPLPEDQTIDQVPGWVLERMALGWLNDHPRVVTQQDDPRG